MRLENKVALITGAARGIGRVAAQLFAREGASVIVADIAEREGEEVASAICERGGKALFLKTNVAEEEDVRNMVARAVESCGQVDILYNNAGIMPVEDSSVIETSMQTWEKIMDCNLKSVFLCCKYTIPHMLERRAGSIINVASFVAFMGASVPQDAYGVSKSGLLGLTRSLAVQYGPYNVRCNAICPGPIATGLLDHLWTSEEARNKRLNRIPLGRFGKPEDVAYLALYLASDESSWMTGNWILVDGGISSHYF